MKETQEEYEYADKRICKYGLQIERCSQCLFDALCGLKQRNADKSNS